MAKQTGSKHFRGPPAVPDVDTQMCLARRVEAEVVELIIRGQRKQAEKS